MNKIAIVALSIGIALYANAKSSDIKVVGKNKVNVGNLYYCQNKKNNKVVYSGKFIEYTKEKRYYIFLKENNNVFAELKVPTETFNCLIQKQIEGKKNDWKQRSK